MKKISLAISLITIATLSACSPKPKKKKSSSEQPVVTSTSVIQTGTSYGPYTGTGGVDVDHITGISITPSKDFYCQVNDVQVIKPSYSPSSKIPDNEKVITWEISDPELADLSVDQTTWAATLTFKKGGDLKITAHSIEDRYQRSVTAHILENSDKVEIYQTTENTDEAKAKFGYVKEFYTKGDADGIAAFGKTTWQFHREQIGEIGTMSGALKFGGGNNTPTDKNNEGRFTLTTDFSRKVEKVIFNVSSAAATDTSSDFGFGGQSKFDYGSALVKATMNGVELDRTVGEQTYPAGTECNSPKYSQDAAVAPVIVDCKNQTGQFIFELGESFGATYFQSIIIFYTEATSPIIGDRQVADFDFSDLTFDPTLKTSYDASTATDSNGFVTMEFSRIRKATGSTAKSTSGFMNIDKASTITIRPTTPGYSFRAVEITLANWITNATSDTPTVKDVNAVLSESYTNGIMFTKSCSLDKGGSGSDFPSSTTTFEGFHIGTNLIKIENSTNGVGLVSMKILLDNAYPSAVVSDTEVIGAPHQVNYEYENLEYHDTFNPKGLLVKASFTDATYSPIVLNDETVWDDLELNATSVSGTTPFGRVTFNGITVTNYEPKLWQKQSLAIGGTYLLTCFDNLTQYPGNAGSADDLRNKNNVLSIDGRVDENQQLAGNYLLDHAYITLTLNKENSNYVGVDRYIFRSASYFYFNGVTSSGAMSYSLSSKQYVTFSFDTEGNAVLQLTKTEKDPDSGDTRGSALDSHVFGVLDGVFGFYPTGTENILPVQLLKCEG